MSSSSVAELRLFVEELCCNLLRFHHVARDRVEASAVEIRQEVWIAPGAFADIRVALPGAAPYFLEVKTGYAPDAIAAHLARKYGVPAPATADANRLIVVADGADDAAAEALRERCTRAVRPGLTVEIWNDRVLGAHLARHFELAPPASVQTMNVPEVRAAIDRWKARFAFGPACEYDAVVASLMWHFGSWRLRALAAGGAGPRDVLQPGLYRGVAVLFADLSSFSSYVRDTRDESIVRHALAAFYSKTRYQVLNTGGMLYQFLGDGVVALFGVPNAPADGGHVRAALACARHLLDIGASVSHDWQRQIDQVQPAAACHIGMALGDLSVLSLRPFSRTHMGAIGESINIAARLTAAAAPDEIVVSNAFFQRLPEGEQGTFVPMDAVDARNVGRIQAWRLRAHRG